MPKLVCSGCGAPITAKTCNYCKNEIDNDTYEAYTRVTSYLNDYNETIKEKTITGEKLTDEEDLKFRELLKYKLIKDEEFYDIAILFHTLSQNKIMSFETFKEYTISFVEKTMRDFTKSINPNWNTSHIRANIEKLEPGWKGCALSHYIYEFNEEEIKKLYDGSLGALTTVLHEMFHGGHDLMITNKMVNPILMQIIKEDIIREDDQKNNDDDSYYLKNYKSISSEIFAQQMATSFLEDLLKKMHLSPPEGFIEYQKNIYDRNLSNQNRIITVDGKEEIMTVDEIFDKVIVNNPKKLDTFPQLNLEYINENGVVRKKNKQELNETLGTLKDPNTIQYLQSVIDKKILS